MLALEALLSASRYWSPSCVWAANAKPLMDFGGKFLVRGGSQTNPEGNWRGRTVVIEFPSYADAVACYESENYRKAKDIRLPVADNDMVIVEGYDG